MHSKQIEVLVVSHVRQISCAHLTQTPPVAGVAEYGGLHAVQRPGLATEQVAHGSLHRMQDEESREAGGAQAVQVVAAPEQFKQAGPHL